MNGITKIATEQGAAFLVGLAVIAIIQPRTPGGAVLLLSCGIAVTNVVIQIIRQVLRMRVNDGETNNPKTNLPREKKRRRKSN